MTGAFRLVEIRSLVLREAVRRLHKYGAFPGNTKQRNAIHTLILPDSLGMPGLSPISISDVRFFIPVSQLQRARFSYHTLIGHEHPIGLTLKMANRWRKLLLTPDYSIIQ